MPGVPIPSDTPYLYHITDGGGQSIADNGFQADWTFDRNYIYFSVVHPDTPQKKEWTIKDIQFDKCLTTGI